MPRETIEKLSGGTTSAVDDAASLRGTPSDEGSDDRSTTAEEPTPATPVLAWTAPLEPSARRTLSSVLALLAGRGLAPSPSDAVASSGFYFLLTAARRPRPHLPRALMSPHLVAFASGVVELVSSPLSALPTFSVPLSGASAVAGRATEPADGASRSLESHVLRKSKPKEKDRTKASVKAPNQGLP